MTGPFPCGNCPSMTLLFRMHFMFLYARVFEIDASVLPLGGPPFSQHFCDIFSLIPQPSSTTDLVFLPGRSSEFGRFGVLDPIRSL